MVNLQPEGMPVYDAQARAKDAHNFAKGYIKEALPNVSITTSDVKRVSLPKRDKMRRPNPTGYQFDLEIGYADRQEEEIETVLADLTSELDRFQPSQTGRKRPRWMREPSIYHQNSTIYYAQFANEEPTREN